ncbi:MAG: tetratricopeptide repeat protein [Chitinophagaceae bacterium]|nr:tetratricopeptide repeat protein [Chitinophagaceae bacterium]
MGIISFKTGFPILFTLLLAPAVNGQKYGLHAIDSMVKSLAAAREDTDKIRLIYRIGDAYTTIDPVKSMQYARDGLARAEKVKWDKGIAAFNISIGSLLSYAGQYDSSIYYYNQAYIINTRIGNTGGIISGLLNIGAAYQDKGDYNKAVEYLFKIVPMAEKENDYYDLSIASHNLSELYYLMGNADKALHYAQEALGYSEKDSNALNKANAMETLTNAWLLKKDTAQAKTWYEKALLSFEQINDKKGVATIYYKLAVIEKDIVKKIGYGVMAQKVWDEIDPAFTISIANLENMGLSFLNSTTHPTGAGWLDSAEKYIRRAYTLSRVTGNTAYIASTTDALARLQEVRGDYKSALISLKEAARLKDSLYSQETRSKIAELETNYRLDKQAAEYKEKQHSATLYVRQLWGYTILALMAITGVFLYFLNKYRIRQLRLQHAVQQQQAERKEWELKVQNQLMQSELKAIRAQMNPHFIFNVLNSIEAFILSNEPKTASRLLQKFAALCRLMLENSTHQYVNAGLEWQALKLYAELEAARFNYQFTYEFEQPTDVNLSELLIPPMMVQPIVENAIHHGFSDAADGDLHFKVTVMRNGDLLIFITEDNGKGLIKTAEEGKTDEFIKKKSLGLALIKERIDIINHSLGKEIAAFSLGPNRSGRGAVATLKLPILSY